MNSNGENCSGDVHDKTLGRGENCNVTKIDQSNYHIGDFEHNQNCFKFINVIFERAICGDVKPPQRIFNQKPPRTPQQIAEDLERKLRESSIRRQNYINSIILRSQKQNEKVAKAREKMMLKQTQNAAQIEIELQKKKESAEQARQQFLNQRVEKFRKQVEHAEAVKQKKMTNMGP